MLPIHIPLRSIDNNNIPEKHISPYNKGKILEIALIDIIFMKITNTLGVVYIMICYIIKKDKLCNDKKDLFKKYRYKFYINRNKYKIIWYTYL